LRCGKTHGRGVITEKQPSAWPTGKPFLLSAILALIGFTAIVAQIVLMRELMVAFYGNEISLGVMLACWLLWTALGSVLLGRFAARVRNPRKLMATLQLLLALFAPVTVLAVRASRALFHALPGELLGPTPILLTCLLTLSGFCAATGCVFVAGSLLRASESGLGAASAVNSVYLLEAAGSALGGLLASIVLLRCLNALQIALLLSALNLGAAANLLLRKRLHAVAAICALIVAWAVAGVPGAARLDTASLARMWPGFQLLETRNSVYGSLAVVETPGVRSLLENGLPLFSAPDPATAEENVHYALLEHPAPKSLLLIGGGAGGSLRQALQHRTLERVDYVELDPIVLELAEQAFAEQWFVARADPRVHIHNADGRFFLKSTGQQFDVIIVALPAPQTAQLNRFYTVDFFHEVSDKLSPEGVFSFQLPAAEEYIAPELGDLLRCIRKSLQQVFPVVRMIPGQTVHFLAAKREDLLAADSAVLLSRLRSRHLQTSYVREYFIPFRMAPDRMRDLEQQTEPRPDTPVNCDLAPIAYYFDVALWGTQFNREYLRAFDWIAALRFMPLALAMAAILTAAAIVVARSRPSARLPRTAAFCTAISGLTMISLEVLLLLGFQAIYGYIYHQLAILIALFMAGLALGNWMRLRTSGSASASTSYTRMMLLAALQLCATLAPLLLYAVLASLAEIRSMSLLTIISQFLFPAMGFLSGLLGGCEFAVATEIYFTGRETSPGGLGMLYGLDLMGACLGALLVSALLVPLFGFWKTVQIISIANVVATLLAVWEARSGQSPLKATT
jgi:spermidine synthase